MKKNSLLWLSAVLMTFSACDKENDRLHEHDEDPVVDPTTNIYRTVEVGFGKSDTLDFELKDPYEKESSYEFKLESFPNENEANGVYAEELLYYFGKDACINGINATSLNLYNTPRLDLGTFEDYHFVVEPILSKTESFGKCIFKLRKETHAEVTYLSTIIKYASSIWGFKYDADADAKIISLKKASRTNLLHEIPFSKEVSARYSLTVRNKTGESTTKYVLVKIRPNRQPVPTLKATCVNKETNEYKISVSGSDPDGHKIEKWSYVFDCTPFTIGSKTLKDNYWKEEDTELQSIFDGYLYYDYFVRVNSGHVVEETCFYWFTFGMSKEDFQKEYKDKESDIITSTTQNEVTHVFQSKGEHTISVRCRDEYGLWSDYVTEKIYIE